MKFVTAAWKFFGPRDGEGIKAFATEIKQLSEKDREELMLGLAEIFGEPITE
jgi:hypothetical protein